MTQDLTEMDRVTKQLAKAEQPINTEQELFADLQPLAEKTLFSTAESLFNVKEHLTSKTQIDNGVELLLFGRAYWYAQLIQKVAPNSSMIVKSFATYLLELKVSYKRKGRGEFVDALKGLFEQMKHVINRSQQGMPAI